MEIAFLASSIVLFVAYLVVSSILYKKREKERFELANHFPFELWIKEKGSDFILSIFLFMPFILLATNYILFAIKFADLPVYVATFLAVANCAIATLLFITPLSKLREHCILVILFITFTAILNGFLIYKEVKIWQQDVNYWLLLPMIINALIVLEAIIMLAHPSLFKFNMARDSEVNIVRPKRFAICIIEWGLMFSLLISQVSIILIKELAVL